MKQLKYNIQWGEHFRLNRESISGLERIKDKYGRTISPIHVGTKHYRKDGSPASWELKFKCSSYSVHRIIWILTYGSIDDSLAVDHLDGNPFNNDIENLKLKTLAGNSRNKRKRKSSRTGITGVSLISSGDGYYYYAAHWMELDKSQGFKCFSIKKLGEEKALALAVAYREDQIKRLISEGAGTGITLNIELILCSGTKIEHVEQRVHELWLSQGSVYYERYLTPDVEPDEEGDTE